MKYQGHRSYFDYIKRQCVPIPVCNDTLSIKSPFNKVISKWFFPYYHLFMWMNKWLIQIY